MGAKTLTDALRKLAERMPEKFEVREHSIFWGGKDWKGDWFEGQTMIDLTQDDLDYIAAEIATGDMMGWEYSVRKTYEGKWEWLIWDGAPNKDHRHPIVDEGEREYRTKLLAAQSALIAIIEKHLTETK